MSRETTKKETVRLFHDKLFGIPLEKRNNYYYPLMKKRKMINGSSVM